MPTTNIFTREGDWLVSADTNYQGYRVNTRTKQTIPTGKRVLKKWATLEDVFPGLVSDRTFLDIGCSQGFFLWKALECGARSAVGIEASGEYFAALAPYIDDQVLMGLYNMRFPHQHEALRADVVMCFSLVHHLFPAMTLEQILAELERVTDETLLVEYIGRSDKMVQKKGWVGQHPEYTLESFLATSRAHFSAIDLLGEGHHETRAVYRMDK